LPLGFGVLLTEWFARCKGEHMIGIAVACMMFMTVLITILRMKHVKLGLWRIPLSIALCSSVGWVFYLALTARIFH